MARGADPSEGFILADGGLVWSRDEGVSARPANILGWHRRGISSLGAGVRLNAGGLPVELAAIRALDGPAPPGCSISAIRVGF